MEDSPTERPDYVLRALDLFAEFGDQDAIVGVGWDGRYTFAQVRTLVLDMAATLRAGGVRPGMTVVVAIAHPPEGPMLQLALHLLGCRTAWVVAGSPDDLVNPYLATLTPDAFIYDARTHLRSGPRLTKELGVPTFCLGPDGLGPDLITGRPDGVEEFDPATATGSVESIFQTSGSTGTPKPIHHLADLYEQMWTLSRDWLTAGNPPLNHLTLTPLWYVAGQTSAMMSLFTGGVLYVMYRFNPEEYLATIERYRANSVYVSPLMFGELLDHPSSYTVDTSSLILLSIGGAATSPARLREGVERFGPVIRITYGLSESPFISAYPGIVDDPAHPDRIRSCGTAYGDVVVEIRDEDGNALPDGETGELWISSRLNFNGYWQMPELTRDTMVNGWLRTRDLGFRDQDGYLHLVGRSQDLIITGIGCDHIFPRPIEEVLATHPEVRAAAVIGVKHDKLGEAAHAFVVLAPEATVTEEELGDLVEERLAHSWRPVSFDFVAELPRTSSGKADIQRLKARYAAQHAGVGV